MELTSAQKDIGVKYYPPASTEFGITDANVNKWLCRAVLSEQTGYVDAYSYLSTARNVYGLDKLDPNLAAAERYMEGYTLHYGELLSPTFLEGLHWLKILRGHPLATWMTGKNGSFSGFSRTVTSWGKLGWSHGVLGLPVGGGSDLGSCELNK